MFKVIAEVNKIVRTVYAVRIDEETHDTEFLIYIGSEWLWMNSNQYKPAER